MLPLCLSTSIAAARLVAPEMGCSLSLFSNEQSVHSHVQMLSITEVSKNLLKNVAELWVSVIADISKLSNQIYSQTRNLLT